MDEITLLRLGQLALTSFVVDVFAVLQICMSDAMFVLPVFVLLLLKFC